MDREKWRLFCRNVPWVVRHSWREQGFRDYRYNREYRGGSSQTPHSVPFCCLLQSARNTVIVFLQPPPQDYLSIYPARLGI